MCLVKCPNSPKVPNTQSFCYRLGLLLTVRSFLLTVGPVAHGKLAWSFSLTLKNSVWYFLLTVPPRPEVGSGFVCLQFPDRK